jgi:hypothetical protein
MRQQGKAGHQLAVRMEVKGWDEMRVEGPMRSAILGEGEGQRNDERQAARQEVANGEQAMTNM